MPKKIDEKRITLKYADEKGEGYISLANPLEFAHGYIDIKYRYDAKLNSSFDIICEFDEVCEDGYEDFIIFYSGEIQLLPIRVKNKPEYSLSELWYMSEEEKAKSLGWCTCKVLAPIVVANDLNLRINSRVRKLEDIKLCGSIMEEFQKSLQVLNDLIKDKQTLATYISEHDESFKKLYEATEKERKEEEKEIKRQKAIERREQKAREEAEEAIRRKAFRNNLVGVIFMAIVWGIAMLVICSAILFVAAFWKDGNNPNLGIMWWGVAIAAGTALIYLFSHIDD